MQDSKTGEYYYLIPPSTDERDAALGQLMDVFSRLEGALFTYFALMFGIPHKEVSEVLYNILDAQSLRTALASLATIRLNQDGQKRIDGILNRAKKATSKRS